MLVKVPVATGV